MSEKHIYKRLHWWQTIQRGDDFLSWPIAEWTEANFTIGMRVGGNVVRRKIKKDV